MILLLGCGEVTCDDAVVTSLPIVTCSIDDDNFQFNGILIKQTQFNFDKTRLSESTNYVNSFKKLIKILNIPNIYIGMKINARLSKL